MQFFRLLVELTKVEIILLLRDALEPESLVPPHWNPHIHEVGVAEPDDSAERSDASRGTGPSSSVEPDLEGTANARLEATPLENRMKRQSPLELMAESSRLVDAMEDNPQGKKGQPSGRCDAFSANEPQFLQLAFINHGSQYICHMTLHIPAAADLSGGLAFDQARTLHK